MEPFRLTAPEAIHTRVRLPLSKSLSNRALLIAALCPELGATRPVVAECDDTAAMTAALGDDTSTHINVGAAGTAMRFLTAYFATREGRTVTLDGSARMRQRPIAPLVEALRQLGANIEYVGEEGFPPLRIKGENLQRGATIALNGSVSSQFVSALLMIAPSIGGMALRLTNPPVSRPYIDMTLAMMNECGASARWNGQQEIVVENKPYHHAPDHIEADWSAASYWFALQCLLPKSSIVLEGLHRDSLQGDSRVMALMDRLGVVANFDGDIVTLSCPKKVKIARFSNDFSDTPDLAPTFAVLLCLKGIPYRLDGLATLRLKETDRIAALQAELRKLGYRLEAGDDYLSWDGNHTITCYCAPLDTYDDHRLAMALSLTATRFPGVALHDANVVNKSYPDYWQHLQEAGVTLR